jgi:hypothetical protein
VLWSDLLLLSVANPEQAATKTIGRVAGSSDKVPKIGGHAIYAYAFQLTFSVHWQFCSLDYRRGDYEPEGSARIRLAGSENTEITELFEYLVHVFATDKALKADMKKLREAIKDGSCTVSEWKPLSGLTQRPQPEGA